jgi:glucose-6-phosphate isomerase
MMNHLCHAQKDILSTKNHHEKNIRGSIFNGAAINHIRLKDISPHSIGALIALYEHKIYVQSVIWQINAFDQPGVEATKQLMKAKLTSVTEY